MTETMKRFADFATEEGPLEGGKVPLDSILNVDIFITGFRVQDSKFRDKNKSGKCLTVQFEREGEAHVFFTGSQVLKNQLEKYGHEIPFWSKVKKIDKYYTLS